MNGETLINWIINRDETLERVAENWRHEPDPENRIASILWDNTASFIDQCIAPDLRGGIQTKDLIQYISYPLYSHDKEASPDNPTPWIAHYPLFFSASNLHTEDNFTALGVIERYATLYRGLLDEATGFAFTGFANGNSFPIPPRCVVISMSASENEAYKIEFGNIGEHNDTLKIQAQLPEATGFSIGQLYDSGAQTLDPDIIPTFNGGYSLENRSRFWEWFEQLADSDNCSTAVTDLTALAENYTERTRIVFSQSAENNLPIKQIQEQRKEHDLTKFCIWNFLLGFRKIVYIPYRTIEPQPGTSTSGQLNEEVNDSRGLIKSSAGIILVLDDALTVHDQVLSSERMAEDTDQAEDTVRQLVASFKTLVDIATSRASIGDAKFYFEKTLLRDQAKGLYHGMTHESRNLHFTAGLAISSLTNYEEDTPNEPRSPGYFIETFLESLDDSVQLSQMIFDAFTKRTAAPLGQIWSKIVHRYTGKLEISPRSLTREISKQLVPSSYEFVFTELFRNTLEYCSGTPRIQASFQFKESHQHVITFNNYTDNEVLNWKRSGTANTTRSSHGLDLVASVIEDICKGSFSFKAENGYAQATIDTTTQGTPEVIPHKEEGQHTQPVPMLALWKGQASLERAKNIAAELKKYGCTINVYEEDDGRVLNHWLEGVKNDVTEVEVILLFIDDTEDSVSFASEMGLLENYIKSAKAPFLQAWPIHPEELGKTNVRNCIISAGHISFPKEIKHLTFKEENGQLLCKNDQLLCDSIIEALENNLNIRTTTSAKYTIFHLEDRRSSRDLFWEALLALNPVYKYSTQQIRNGEEQAHNDTFGLIQVANISASNQFISKSKFSPHLAIIDLHIEGGLNGKSIVKKAIRHWPNCKVRIVTGHEDQEDNSELTEIIKANPNVKFIKKSAAGVYGLMKEIYKFQQEGLEITTRHD